VPLPAIRPLARALARDLRSHDVVLYAAAVSFYAARVAVPALLAPWATGRLVGTPLVASLGDRGTLPDQTSRTGGE
jgi:hypothetical protein